MVRKRGLVRVVEVLFSIDEWFVDCFSGLGPASAISSAGSWFARIRTDRVVVFFIRNCYQLSGSGTAGPYERKKKRCLILDSALVLIYKALRALRIPCAKPRGLPLP